MDTSLHGVFSMVNRVQGSTQIDQALRFTDADIVTEMNRSPTGKAVVDAADSDAIDLEFQPFHPQSGVLGHRVPNSNRGVVFVENNVQFSAPGVVDRAATLREVANTAVHEGLHALGIGGSWEAELRVRELTFEHNAGRAPAPAEVAQMEADIRAVGTYTSLPITVGKAIQFGGRNISF
jgi:hypothetical protein